MQKTVNASILIVMIIALASITTADTDIKNEWLAQYPDACATLTADVNSCGACHGGGFSLNQYAQDYMDNGESWTAIEAMDSDGDEQLNGQEIASCTKPWDSGSLVSNDQGTWSGIKNLWR